MTPALQIFGWPYSRPAEANRSPFRFFAYSSLSNNEGSPNVVDFLKTSPRVEYSLIKIAMRGPRTDFTGPCLVFFDSEPFHIFNKRVEWFYTSLWTVQRLFTYLRELLAPTSVGRKFTVLAKCCFQILKFSSYRFRFFWKIFFLVC